MNLCSYNPYSETKELKRAQGRDTTFSCVSIRSDSDLFKTTSFKEIVLRSVFGLLLFLKAP